MAKKVIREYDESVCLLIDRVRLMRSSGYKSTPERKALERLAKKLDEVIALMDQDTFWCLEMEFDHPSPGYVHQDGTSGPDIDRSGKFSGTRWRMNELAEFARKRITSLPDPRHKPALPFAAKVLLHILYFSGAKQPSIYDGSTGVVELRRVCEAAEIYLSDERLRGALSDALKQFDPWDYDVCEDILFNYQ